MKESQHVGKNEVDKKGVRRVICVHANNMHYSHMRSEHATLQSPKKWLVRGLVKFTLAVARLVYPDLLG